MISRRSVAAVAALALTTLGTLSAAGAAPAERRATAGYPTTIRPIRQGGDTAVFVDGEASVRKAKTVISVPLTLQRVYANETSHQVGNELSTVSPTWVVTNPGPHPTFGIFPVVHSAVLGFGAVPITADLHLQQVVKHGQIAPLIVSAVAQTVPPFHTSPTHVRGEVMVRIDNVRVDEVPLRVGPNCHSAFPMKLDLVGLQPGYTLFNGGPLRGTVTIPRFAGCGTSGDDLDPLFTGTVSGPGNKIVLHQGALAPWNVHQPHDCGGCHPPKH